RIGGRVGEDAKSPGKALDVVEQQRRAVRLPGCHLGDAAELEARIGAGDAAQRAERVDLGDEFAEVFVGHVRPQSSFRGAPKARARNSATGWQDNNMDEEMDSGPGAARRPGLTDGARSRPRLLPSSIPGRARRWWGRSAT